jgi:predicted nucleic acid-binding protein
VALDTVALVYFLENHPVHGDAARRLLVRIEKGEVSGSMSALIFTELLVPAYRVGDAGRANSVFRILADFPNLSVFDVTPDIAAASARLRALYGLRTPDSIHAATALAAKANVLVTNDRDLLKVGGEVAVWRFDADPPQN